jgi:hypothetical protein
MFEKLLIKVTDLIQVKKMVKQKLYIISFLVIFQFFFHNGMFQAAL